MIEFTEDQYTKFIKSSRNHCDYEICRHRISDNLFVCIDFWKSTHALEISVKLGTDESYYDIVILNSTNTIPLVETHILPFELVKTVFNSTIYEFKLEIEKLKTSILLNLN